MSNILDSFRLSAVRFEFGFDHVVAKDRDQLFTVTRSIYQIPVTGG